MTARAWPSVPLSELTEYCRCPKCRRGVGLFLDTSLQAFRSDFQCKTRNCDQHWWAMRLHAGAVLPQLETVVSDALASELLIRYALPDSLALPMYWQLALSGHEAYFRTEERKAGRSPTAVPRQRRPA